MNQKYPTQNLTEISESVFQQKLIESRYKTYEILSNEELKENYRKKSLERAKMFSWRQTAEETWKIYEEAYKI